jgi:hypothetical protein
MRGLEPQSRRDADADKHREEVEQKAFGVPRRHRRKVGRTEVISIRTFPDVKRMIIAMADAEEKSLVEIIEDAIRTRNQRLRGNRP